MTTKEFLKSTGLTMSLPTLRKLLKQKEDVLKGTGSVIMYKSGVRTTYNIIEPQQVLKLIS